MSENNSVSSRTVTRTKVGKLTAILLAASFATGCAITPAHHSGLPGIDPVDVHHTGRHLVGAVSSDTNLILSHGYGHNRGHKRPSRRHGGYRGRGRVHGSYHGHHLPAVIIGTAVVLAVLAGLSHSDSDHDHDRN